MKKTTFALITISALALSGCTQAGSAIQKATPVCDKYKSIVDSVVSFAEDPNSSPLPNLKYDLSSIGDQIDQMASDLNHQWDPSEIDQSIQHTKNSAQIAFVIGELSDCWSGTTTSWLNDGYNWDVAHDQ